MKSGDRRLDGCSSAHGRARACPKDHAPPGRYSRAMSLEPSFEEQELLADTLRRAGSGMTRRELLAEVIVGAGFVAAVAGLWWLSPRTASRSPR